VTLKAKVTLANWATVTLSRTVDFSARGRVDRRLRRFETAKRLGHQHAIFQQTGNVNLTASYSGDANASGASASTQITLGKMAASS
jgi:hypothetical protein